MELVSRHADTRVPAHEVRSDRGVPIRDPTESCLQGAEEVVLPTRIAGTEARHRERVNDGGSTHPSLGRTAEDPGLRLMGDQQLMGDPAEQRHEPQEG